MCAINYFIYIAAYPIRLLASFFQNFVGSEVWWLFVQHDVQLLLEICGLSGQLFDSDGDLTHLLSNFVINQPLSNCRCV